MADTELSYAIFYYGSQDAFDALATKNDDCLYFIIDKQHLYKGSNLIASSDVVFSTTVPEFANAVANKLYVVATETEVSLYVKGTTEMVQVAGGSLKPGSINAFNLFDPNLIATSASLTSNNKLPDSDTLLVTPKAVNTAIEKALENITPTDLIFVSSESALTTLGTPPNGVPADLTVGMQAMVTDTSKLYYLTEIGDSAPTSYVWKTQASDAPVWNGTSTDIVKFWANTLASYNTIDPKDDNTLYFTTDAGKIFKGSVDVTQSVELVESWTNVTNASAVSNKLYIGPAPTSTDSGYDFRIKGETAWIVINPGYYTDGANWATADSGKFATIGLIKTAINNAVSDLANKVNTITGGTVGNIVTVAANGQIADSGKVIGEATLSTTPNANTLATESAVDTAIKEALAWHPISSN